MELRAMRYFVAVADLGSFRAAATREGVSQPAISQSMAGLERELGGRLFDRVGREVVLTPAGRALADPARRVVADFDALPAILEPPDGPLRGRLEIGTTDVASIYVLPKVYRKFRSRHPRVELSVRVEGTESLLDQLRAGAIEVAIVNVAAGGLPALIPSGFTSEPLYRESLGFIVSRRHPLAARRRVQLKELADTPLITFKEESITRQAIDAWFREDGLTPDVAMEMSSPEAIKRLVEVGLGASVLPSRSVSAEVRSGMLVALSVRGRKLDRILGVVRDARRSPSPALSAFLELVEGIRNVDAGTGA